MKKLILIVNCLKNKQFKWAVWHLQGKNIFEESKKEMNII